MKSVDPGKIFHNLGGEWSLDRDIPGIAKMVGTASFEPRGDHALTYSEAGRLTLGDGSIYEAHRRYLYRYRDGKIAVYFADGGRDRELFHILEFPPDREMDWPVTAEGYHLCAADHYRLRHHFLEADTFEQEILVEGPRKNYRSLTRFERHLPLALNRPSA